MSNNKSKTRWQRWLLGLMGIAFFLRVYHLSEYPSGFQNDEASFLYNTQTLLKTGLDEDGRRWPIYLHSFIDPKPALISYLQMPFVAVLDDDVLASRLPGVLFGVGSLWLLWRLLFYLGLPARLQVIMVGLLVISPWHILISRSTQEVVASFFFGVLSLVCLEKLLRLASRVGWVPKVTGLMVLFSMSFLLSVYLYHSAKIVMPLLVWLFLWWHTWRKVSLSVSGCLGFISLALVCLVTFGTTAGLKRYETVGLLSGSDMKAILTEQIALSTHHANPFFIRMFHNKVEYLFLLMGKTYFEHFTGTFLFFFGGEPQRYAIPFQGLFYHVELLWLVLGMLIAFRRTKKNKHVTWLFLVWLAIAPLPASVTTQEVPSVIRAFWMLVPLTYFIAVGIDWAYIWSREIIVNGVRSLFKKVMFPTIFVGGYLWGLLYGWHQWAVFQPRYHPWYRNYADQEMTTKLAIYTDAFQKVVIASFSGQPYVYLALSELFDASELQTSYPMRRELPFAINKYIFGVGECPIAQERQTLFVVRENCRLPLGYRVIDKATYLDGNDGYMFVVWDE